LERLKEIAKEFYEIQQQIINEIDEFSEIDIVCETKFKERDLAMKTGLRRVISNASADAKITESDVLTQLLQRNIAMMDIHEVEGALQAQATSDAMRGIEQDEPLETLLHTN